jgi:hypothetical protein
MCCKLPLHPKEHWEIVVVYAEPAKGNIVKLAVAQMQAWKHTEPLSPYVPLRCIKVLMVKTHLLSEQLTKPNPILCLLKDIILCNPARGQQGALQNVLCRQARHESL